MKIGMIVSAEFSPPKFWSGAEISAYYLSGGLEKLGQDVRVIAPNPNVKKPILEERDGLKIYWFPFPDIFKVKEKFPSKRLSHPDICFRIKKGIKFAVKEFKPDILHVQSNPAFIPAYRAGRGIKMVATLRDYNSYCDSGICGLTGNFKQCSFFQYLKCKYKWEPSLVKLLHYVYDYFNLRERRKILREMDGLISVSKAVRNVYKIIGIESIVIHNIAPMLEVKKSASEIKKELGVSGRIVSYIGKISIGKGADYFLDMVKTLKDVNFVVAGTGPLKRDFIAASEKYKNLKYLGKIPHEKVMEVYKISDVICSTSVWPEPLSRIPIEALSLGIPCVATNVGGTGEIIDDGVNGFLVKSRNVEELVKKVKILLLDKKLRKKFARNGKKKIKNEFSTDKITNEHINFYKRVLGD